MPSCIKVELSILVEQIISPSSLNEINFLKIHGIGKAKFQSYFKDIKRIFDLKNNL